MKNIAIVAFLCLIATACTKKIHAEDIVFHNDTVYYEGQPFTGEIWTSDNTTGCIDEEYGDAIDIISFERRYTKLWIKILRMGGEFIKAYQRNQNSRQQETIQIH